MADSQHTETKSWPGEIPLRSEYTAGKAGQTFFTALKQGKLLASHCAECDQTYFPMRLFCERCFAELTGDIEIKPTGTLISFTICHFDHDRKPLIQPIALGLVQLDGASTVFLHRLLEAREAAQLQIGAPVELILAPEDKRTGSILDIEGFRLT
jgi:uncharacterized OB-fold protein